MTSSEAQVDSATATKDEQTPTIDSFDETEEKLGISAYMSLGDGFSAVVKARYSDFLVHEVDMDGKVARLTNRDIPVDKTQEPEGDDQQQDNNERATNEPKTWKQLQSELEGMIKDAAIAGSVFTMLTSHNNRAEYEDKFVTLPALEKEERSAIHNWIRNSIHCARADTLDGKIRIWHVRFEKGTSNHTNCLQ